MATVVTGLACSLSLQSSAYLQGLNAAAMATTTAAARMQGAFNATTAATNAATAAVGRQAVATARGAAATRAMNTSLLAGARGAMSMATGLRGIITFLGVRQVMQWSDAWQEAKNKLAAAEQIAGVQGRSMEALNQIAAATRSPIQDIVDLYAKLIRTASGVVKSESDIAQITQTVAEAFKAGGASTLEQVNGIRQLAQALGSGILQGDELRSIRENAPLVAKAIAEELGTTVAGLKKLGAEGKITSDVIARALIKAQGEIHQAFEQTTPTISDSFVRLNSAVIQYVGHVNEGTGASRDFSKAISLLARNFEPLMDSVFSNQVITEANRMFMNVGNAVKIIADRFTALTSVDTSGWWGTVISYAQKAWNFISSVAGGLKAINDEVERKATGKVALPELDFKKVREMSDLGFGGGVGAGAGEGGAGDAQKAADKALKEHWSLINDVGSAQEKYQVQLEEIKAKNYSVADATRANANALLEYQNNLDKQAEALGLQLTPLQEYEAAIRQVAFAEQQWHISSEMAFTARAVAAAKFASTTLAAFGALSGALTQLFKENKAVAIANAIISTAEGIANSLKLLPSPLAWVYAAAAAVTGAAQIATILSTEPGSGSKTPTVKSAGSAASTSAATATAGEAASNKRGASQTVNITVQGESGFTAQQVRELIGHINEAVGDGVHLRVN